VTTPINLNKARKAKARAEKEQRAQENRLKFGRSKAQKTGDKLSRKRLDQQLDQTRRDS
jgi:Domain of unknown function (DUF4169)